MADQDVPPIKSPVIYDAPAEEKDPPKEVVVPKAPAEYSAPVQEAPPLSPATYDAEAK